MKKPEPLQVFQEKNYITDANNKDEISCGFQYGSKDQEGVNNSKLKYE